MPPMYRRLPVFALVVAAGLLLGSCGKEAGLARPVGPADGAASTGLPSFDPASSPEAGGKAGSDKIRTTVLDTSVRLVNLYIPQGSQQGSPVDVWIGSPAYGGKKLQTVAYGQAGEYFPVEVMDPVGGGQTDPHMNYSLGFFPPGKTAASDELIGQSEDSSPGQKLTMVIMPSDPALKGASLQVFADDLGSSPQGGGFHTLSVPPAPAGAAILLLGAAAMQYRGAQKGTFTSMTTSTADGKCVDYVESDTGKIHDPASNTMDLIGGTSSLPYVMKPGAQFRLNKMKSQGSIQEACSGEAVFGPVDPGLAAGQRAYGFVYGAQMQTAKLLVVPVG